MTKTFPLTRRQALETSAAVALLGRATAADAQTPPAAASASGVPTMTVHMTVNGHPETLTIDTRTTLLEGRRINSCLTLAVMHDGQQVTTIEGLGTPEHLHPMQAAFVHHDGYQCGYCTPGQICSAVGMLSEHKAGWPSVVTDDLATTPKLTGAELRERMSGNLCRCSAYPNIAAAITDAAGETL